MGKGVDPVACETYSLKFVLVGASGVGKSNLVLRFCRGNFVRDSRTTIGIEFATKEVQISEGTRVKAQIWDTAGQERFDALTSVYFRDAVGAMLVYDVTSRSSFEELERWYGKVKECAHESAIIMCVGNKSDCSESRREVQYEDGLRFARERKLDFMETSAMNAENVEMAFRRMVVPVARLLPGVQPHHPGGIPDGWVRIVRPVNGGQPSKPPPQQAAQASDEQKASGADDRTAAGDDAETKGGSDAASAATATEMTTEEGGSTAGETNEEKDEPQPQPDATMTNQDAHSDAESDQSDSRHVCGPGIAMEESGLSKALREHRQTSVASTPRAGDGGAATLPAPAVSHDYEVVFQNYWTGEIVFAEPMAPVPAEQGRPMHLLADPSPMQTTTGEQEPHSGSIRIHSPTAAGGAGGARQSWCAGWSGGGRGCVVS